MSGKHSQPKTHEPEDIVDILRRVRHVDPTADDEAVRRYVREIAEADAVLLALGLSASGTPLETPFSPLWTSEQKP